MEAIIGNCWPYVQRLCSSKNSPVWLALSRWAVFYELSWVAFCPYTFTDKATETEHSWWVISLSSVHLFQNSSLFCWKKEQTSIFNKVWVLNVVIKKKLRQTSYNLNLWHEHSCFILTVVLSLKMPSWHCFSIS